MRRTMQYRNGKLERTVILRDEDMRALLEGTLSDYAQTVLRNHVDGPPHDVMCAIEDKIQDWKLDFVGDSVRIETTGTVRLQVCPDASWDGDRYQDETSVDAIWMIDGQRIEFELDPSIEHEVIQQWDEHRKVHAG